MSYNLFGKLFRFMTWGESHGPAIGCVIDGAPPRISLTEADIQYFLDQRRPGQSRHTTQRQEADQVKIMSGVFEGRTTGTPISLIIDNTDARSKDYGDIAHKFRPGHADYTYQMKYGLRDYRGGGRSSARETAMRVAAGAVARKILPSGISIKAGVVQIGPHKINRDQLDWDSVYDNPFFCPDPSVIEAWAEFLDQKRKEGSSVGAVVECVISGAPAGLGAPVYAKIEADLAAAMIGINAVKGVEFGAGFDVVNHPGEETVDEMRAGEDNDPVFQSNHAGGILGGITTGQDIVLRVAFKPTSSLLTPRKTITDSGENTEIVTKGRHDPCVGLRGTPVVEAMAACVLADHLLLHKAQCQ
jgi:chorismate synthase